MKIILSRRAAAYARDSEDAITDPRQLRQLDGLLYSKAKCADYLDRSLEDMGIRGGVIRLAFDPARSELRVVTEYQTARRLRPAELKQLVANTTGQWSDGIGEEDFLHRNKLKMDVDLYPFAGGKVRVEQIDDGKKVRPPRINALVKALEDSNLRAATKLVAEGAELGVKNKEGETPLHLACAEGYFDLALQMIERGANVKVASKSGETPLATLARAEVSRARADRAIPVAEALLRWGASIERGDRQGMTPLMWAVNRGCLPLIQFLIDAGADVNARDRDRLNRLTVLMYAQRLDVVELLLHHGADPAARNASGETAWEYALLNDHLRGYRKMSEVLRAHGETK